MSGEQRSLLLLPLTAEKHRELCGPLIFEIPAALQGPLIPEIHVCGAPCSGGAPFIGGVRGIRG